MARLPARVAPRMGALIVTALARRRRGCRDRGRLVVPERDLREHRAAGARRRRRPGRQRVRGLRGRDARHAAAPERARVEDPRSELASLAWSSPQPLPGNVTDFTNGAPALSAATAAASGEGAGVDRPALRRVAARPALVRQPDDDFSAPGGRRGRHRRDDRRARRRDRRQRRDAGRLPRLRRPLGLRPRALQLPRPRGQLHAGSTRSPTSDGPAPSVAQADDGWPVIAWTNRSTAYVVADRRHRSRHRAAAHRRRRVAAARSSPRSATAATASSPGSTTRATCASSGAAPPARSRRRCRSTARAPDDERPRSGGRPARPRVRRLARDAGRDRAASSSRRRRSAARSRSSRSPRAPTSAAPVITRAPTAARPSPGPPRPAGRPSPPRGEVRHSPRSRPCSPATTSNGAQATLIAGPGPRVELVWRQQGDVEPNTGPIVFAASDSGS